MKKVVVLLNMGGVDELAHVRVFLKNMFKYILSYNYKFFYLL